MRLNPFSVVVALLHLYIGVRLLSPFDVPVQMVGSALLALLFLLLPKGFHSRKQSPGAVMRSWTAAGFFSWLLVTTLRSSGDSSLSYCAD